MLSWQIKVLEHELLNYQEWAENAVVCNVYPDVNSALFGYLKKETFLKKEFYETENGIIKEREVEKTKETFFKGKLEKILERMIKQYESQNGNLSQDLTNEEKVNIITSQEGYKNRIEKENNLNNQQLTDFKNLIKEKIDLVFPDEIENQNKKNEIDNCQTIQEASIIHYNVHILIVRQKLNNQCQSLIFNETERQKELDLISCCQTCKELDDRAKILTKKYEFNIDF